MKLTLLDMVQRVLESIGSDSVNSIGDTEESTEVAYVIRDVYLEMLSTRDWPHLKKTSTLTSLGNTSKPTHFDIPEDTQEIIPDTLKYNVSETVTPEWKTLRYLTPEQFLDLSAGRAGDTNVQTVQDNVPLYIYDNVHLRTGPRLTRLRLSLTRTIQTWRTPLRRARHSVSSCTSLTLISRTTLFRTSLTDGSRTCLQRASR